LEKRLEERKNDRNVTQADSKEKRGGRDVSCNKESCGKNDTQFKTIDQEKKGRQSTTK